jgi:hypothetical protein
MALIMPRTKEDMLKKIIEMTRIKYDMYKLDRLLTITCLFGSKLDEEKSEDLTNGGLKRKRDAITTSNYFQDKTNNNSEKKEIKTLQLILKFENVFSFLFIIFDS